VFRTSAYKIQKPGYYPEEIQQGESWLEVYSKNKNIRDQYRHVNKVKTGCEHSTDW